MHCAYLLIGNDGVFCMGGSDSNAFPGLSGALAVAFLLRFFGLGPGCFGSFGEVFLSATFLPCPTGLLVSVTQYLLALLLEMLGLVAPSLELLALVAHSHGTPCASVGLLPQRLRVSESLCDGKSQTGW